MVDVIPVNTYDLERLKSYSINKYWQAGDPMRQDLPKVSFSFVSGNNLDRELKATDPKWQQWTKSGVQYLVIIADLPGVYQDGLTGSQDPRRQILPICKCYWPSKTKDLVVEVQASGVRIVTSAQSRPTASARLVSFARPPTRPRCGLSWATVQFCMTNRKRPAHVAEPV